MTTTRGKPKQTDWLEPNWEDKRFREKVKHRDRKATKWLAANGSPSEQKRAKRKLQPKPHKPHNPTTP